MAVERKVIKADDDDQDDKDLHESPGEGGEEEVIVSTDEERLPAGEYVSLEHTKEGEEGVDEETEARRQRRREERKRQKQRDREYKTTLEATVRQQAAHIAELSGRVSNVETHARAGGAQQIDNAIANAKQVVADMNQAITDGVKANNGQLVAEAQDRLFDAKLALRDLEAMKARHARPPAQPAMDPSVTAMSKAWAARNPWYKPDVPGDEDTVIATSIDALVNAAGYDPRTEAYWDELDRRLARRLPHRYRNRGQDDYDEDEMDEPAPRRRANGNGEDRRRTPRTGGSGSGRPGGGGEGESFFLSAERRSAMMEDGSWNDPEKKKRRIEYYKRYDAEHSSGRGR